MIEVVHLNISPLLISTLTGRSPEEVPAIPNISDLPGNYVQLVAKNFKKVPPAFPSNIQPLICENCKKKARYDLGHVTINIQKYQSEKTEDIDNHIQSTGYFRCNHCNSAGKWEITNEYRMMALAAVLTFNSPLAENRFTFGENMLFDGSSHKYATDAEEYLLNNSKKSKDAPFLWNRLGNLYYKGGRPDLAVSAFEQSISLDPMQTESLFSLGMILSELAPKDAANQYHRMLITAGKYTRMDATNLRDLLSNALGDLLYMQSSLDSEISIIPPMSLYQEYQIDSPSSEEGLPEIIKGKVDSDNLESFYPIAEIFMGRQHENLPKKKVYFVKKKKKNRKKR